MSRNGRRRRLRLAASSMARSSSTLNAFAKIAAPVRHEGQYLHPGPIHIANAARLRNEKPEWGLNTDGHIISSILGRSETIPVVDKQLILGEFGRIYFADLDSVRER